MTPRSRTSDARSSRLWGVDCARAVALLGMFAVHILPLTHASTGDPTWVGEVFAGRSAALFAVLAGVGLALLTGAHSPERISRELGSRRIRVTVRAGMIIVIGLAVALLDSGVAIILVHYGVMFLLALPFLRLGARSLAALAILWALAGPALWRFVQLQLRDGLAPMEEPERLWSSPSLLHLLSPESLPVVGLDLLVTGYYPLLIWPAFFFAGMALGRLDLRSTATAVKLLVGGAVGAAALWLLTRWMISSTSVVSELSTMTAESSRGIRGALITGDHMLPVVLDDRWFLMAVPHQGSPTEVLHNIGCAAAVLGASLLLAKVLPWALIPLVGAGSMPLTLYVGHLILLQLWRPVDAPLSQLSPEVFLLILIAAALIGGVIKTVMGRRGPLEAMVHAVSTSVVSQR